MSEPTDKDQPRDASEDPRLPYEPPAIVGEQTFETLALSCGKGPDVMVPACTIGGSVS